MNTRMTLSALALVTVAVAAVSTAAMADRGGPEGMGGPAPFLDFGTVDADKDGKITKAEIEAFRTARAAAIDADKDGKLSATELKAQAMERAGERADEMVARMIERHDSDADGMLSAAELAAGPSPVPMFDRIDADGDGAITEAEAEAARKHIAKRMGRHHGRGGDHEAGLFGPGAAD
jgi:EF hand